MNTSSHRKYVSIFPGNNQANLRNAIFDPRKSMDTFSWAYVYLKKYLEQKNIDINTYDIPTTSTPYRYVYIDLPYPIPSNLPVWKLIILNKPKNILICHEPPMVMPLSYMKIFHPFFTKIYTWNDDLVDNKKYFKIELPQHSWRSNTSPKDFKHKKFLLLINSNKLPFFPFKVLSQFGRELYSERIKAIEFFEQKIPKGFFLYGRGWNKTKKYNLRERIFGFKKYATYKGEIQDKFKLLSNFKYCICFENMTNVNGYIEKIFDCFKAKCVPIYWGASNVEKYIPNKCFIDYRDFGSYEKLLNFLFSIDENRYNRYVKNIENLLADKKFTDLWFEKGFANFFLKNILEIRNDR